MFCCKCCNWYSNGNIKCINKYDKTEGTKFEENYNNGNKSSEYNVYTYMDCSYSDEECDSFLGDQSNFEIKNGKFSSYFFGGVSFFFLSMFFKSNFLFFFNINYCLLNSWFRCDVMTVGINFY